MSANISKTKDGQDTVFVVGEPPWHKLGKILDKPANAREAIHAAGMGWDVALETVRLYEQNGGTRPINGYSAVIRQDTQNVLGIVKGRYVPIQNSDAFGFFDAVVGGGQAIYHSAGALGLGERVWIMAKLDGAIRVDGTDDLVEKYLLLSSSHDGTESLTMRMTPVRVVCQNTLEAAIQGTRAAVKIRHTESAPTRVAQAQKALGLAARYYDSLGAEIQKLHSIRLTAEQVKKYVEEVFPVGGVLSTRTENIRETVLQLCKTGIGNDMKGIEGTLWGAMNGVTEYVSYHRGTRGKTSSERLNNRLESLWFGSGSAINARAWEVAQKFATVAQ